MAGRQAKVLSQGQMKALLHYVASTRYPSRDEVMVLLSHRAGLRAAEIAAVEWGMVLTAEGVVGDMLELHDRVAKRGGGGSIPLARDLRAALTLLHAERKPDPSTTVVHSERGARLTAGAVVQRFRVLYSTLGFIGASSHSGRRGFITQAARRISTVGGSIRDVQHLARHRSLSVTAGYIDVDSDAQRRVVDLI